MLTVSSSYSWIINSRISSHMTDIKDNFDSLKLSDKYPLAHIADRPSSSMAGDGAVHITSH